jgi:hypothetical protein
MLKLLKLWDKKLLYLGRLEWHYFCNKFYKILPSAAKVISWETDWQTDWWFDKPTFVFLNVG